MSKATRDDTGEAGRDAPLLAPGTHAPASGTYSYRVGHHIVHADSARVGDMLGSGLRTWDDPLVASSLGAARANHDIGEQERALLPWALATVSAQSPAGLGLIRQARYSGPGATSLVGNLGHPRRGYAFAAELITAACLVYRGWTATDGATVVGDAREQDARLDFGVKLIGAGTRRRTVEADVLLTYPDGRRCAVDVKAARVGAYRAPPSAAMLEVVAQALDREEISSFHFVTRSRFRPAVHAAVASSQRVYVHEGVWPSERDRQSIQLQEAAAIDYGRALLASERDGLPDFEALAALLIEEAAAAYRRATPGRRSLVEVPLRFSYLFDDTTAASGAGPVERLVAAWGNSFDGVLARDRRFMAGFPLPSSTAPLDRGHLIARQAGGDEGVGINLIPQVRGLNRGHGADGRRWRFLERLAAEHPGSGLFVRALYDDPTDIPVRLDYLLVTPDGLVQLERFPNRRNAP